MSAPAERPEVPAVPQPAQAARQQLRRLAERAKELGRRQELLTALQAIERRLQTEPQVFGEPYNDFPAAGLQARAGGVGLLYVRYGVDAANRVVYVTACVVS